MKIFELANKLKAIYDQHGDIEVMFTGPNDQDTFGVYRVEFTEAEEGDYPEAWAMPAGFKFVNLSN